MATSQSLQDLLECRRFDSTVLDALEDNNIKDIDGFMQLANCDFDTLPVDGETKSQLLALQRALLNEKVRYRHASCTRDCNVFARNNNAHNVAHFAIDMCASPPCFDAVVRSCVCCYYMCML